MLLVGCGADTAAPVEVDAGSRSGRSGSAGGSSEPDRALPTDEPGTDQQDEPDDIGRQLPTVDAGAAEEVGGGVDADASGPTTPDAAPVDTVDTVPADVASVESDTAYNERTIELPSAGFTQLPGSLFETDWAWNAPLSACSGGPGPIGRYADVYRVTTPSATPIEAEFRLVTARQNGFVSLADGDLHVFSAAGPWSDSSTCVATGTLTVASQSAVSAVAVSSAAPVWVVVTSSGEGVEGSYDLLVGLTSATQSTDPNCSDSCLYAGNGTCQDGARGSDGDQCTLGTDCTDCGVRDPSAPPTGGDIELCDDSCGPLFVRDGFCDDGGPSGDGFGICDFGTDCTDCGPRVLSGCTDTCLFAYDGECDDGRPGSVTSLCTPGTDCADCGSL